MITDLKIYRYAQAIGAMRTSADSRGRRYGGGGDHDGRLHVAALANDQAAVHVLGSASLRTDAVDRRQASSRASSISVENEEELGDARMDRLARGGGNSTIAAHDLHRWALDAMQMGRNKGKRKTAVQGPRRARKRAPTAMTHRRSPLPGPSGDLTASPSRSQTSGQTRHAAHHLYWQTLGALDHEVDCRDSPPVRPDELLCLECSTGSAWTSRSPCVGVCGHVCARARA